MDENENIVIPKLAVMQKNVKIIKKAKKYPWYLLQNSSDKPPFYDDLEVAIPPAIVGEIEGLNYFFITNILTPNRKTLKCDIKIGLLIPCDFLIIADFVS